MAVCRTRHCVLEGLDRFEAREAVVLERSIWAGIRIKSPHRRHCLDRNVQGQVEPMLSTVVCQKWPWQARFGRCRNMETRCAQDLGKILLCLDIRDWCISRQLRCGTILPAWYCSGCDHINVAVDKPYCEVGGSADLRCRTSTFLTTA